MLARVHIKDRKHKILKRNIFLIREYKTVRDVKVHRFLERQTVIKFMHFGKRFLIIWAFDRKIIARVHIKTRKHKILKRNIFLIREYKTVLDVEVHRFA